MNQIKVFGKNHSEKGKACSQPEATFSNEDTDSDDVVFPALHGQMEQFAASKMFILISTVMTWALTEPLDPVSGPMRVN